MENRKSGKSEGERQAAKQREAEFNRGLLLMLFLSCERNKNKRNHSSACIFQQDSNVCWLSDDGEEQSRGGQTRGKMLFRRKRGETWVR